MKRGRNINILLLFLISIVFFNFVSAANTCSSSNQIILRLNSDTNAHGEVWNGAGSYTTEICYDQIFVGEVGDGNRVCDGTNRVLKLSSSTNAHAEGPLGTNYNTEICYSNLNCDLRSAPSCIGNDGNGNPLKIIVRLSSSTNAHLENASGVNYNNAICCSMTGAVLPPPPAQCSDGVDNDADTFIDFPSDPGCADLNDNDETDIIQPPLPGPQKAYWADDIGNQFANGANVPLDTSVILVAEGVLGVNTIITYEIYDSDCLLGFDISCSDKIRPRGSDAPLTANSDSSGIASLNYILTLVDFAGDDDNENILDLYFVANASSVGYQQISERLDLEKNLGPPPPGPTPTPFPDPQGREFCIDYDNEVECNNDASMLAKNSADPTYQTLGCDNAGSNCKCKWKDNGDADNTNDCVLVNEVIGETDPSFPPDSCTSDCFYPNYVTGECINDIQTITATANFEYDPSCANPSQLQQDVGCVDINEGSISCGISGSPLTLPFFGAIQFIMAGLIILGIYFLLILRKRG